MNASSRNSRVRVYIASSLDGFIAGPEDDLSWLPDPAPGEDAEHDALNYNDFIADVGALLMGRRTYDVVCGFDVDWPYGERPVLVASHRDLGAGAPQTVKRVEGPISELVAQAKLEAGDLDVYIDGGGLIRQACEAGLVDELNIFFAPVAIGAGHPLFAGLERAYEMEIVGLSSAPGGMLHVRLVPRGSAAPSGV